ncbi:head maturation protease [Staphylococcus phage Alsa_2]|nr:head maturation protease [Staphylococcus phage Alsa_2]
MAENTKQFSLTPEQEKAIKAFTTGYGVSPDTQVDASGIKT